VYIISLKGIAKRLPLGEAGAENGTSEPFSVTDEGSPCTDCCTMIVDLDYGLPSSAPVCALGHLPPGEGEHRSAGVPQSGE